MNQQKPLVYKPISEWNYRIYFDWIHQNYGRAEFVVCPKFKRGRIYQVFLTTKQQVPIRGWIFKANSNSLSISSYTELDTPKVWIHGWCKDHKTQYTAFYSPSNAEFLDVQILSTFHLTFGKEKK